MNFEVINSSGITVMSTKCMSCIPDDKQLSSMSKAGYKFKIDSKAVSIKKIKEFISEERLKGVSNNI